MLQYLTGLNQTTYSIIIHSGQKQGSLILLPRSQTLPTSSFFKICSSCF